VQILWVQSFELGRRRHWLVVRGCMNSAALVEGAGMAEIHWRKGEIRMSGLPA
jgi:hypothetical protein